MKIQYDEELSKDLVLNLAHLVTCYWVSTARSLRPYRRNTTDNSWFRKKSNNNPQLPITNQFHLNLNDFSAAVALRMATDNIMCRSHINLHVRCHWHFTVSANVWFLIAIIFWRNMKRQNQTKAVNAKIIVSNLRKLKKK